MVKKVCLFAGTGYVDGYRSFYADENGYMRVDYASGYLLFKTLSLSGRWGWMMVKRVFFFLT